MAARARLVLVLCLLLAGVAVPTAAADGPAAGAAVLGKGVANPGGAILYTAVPKGRGVEIEAKGTAGGNLLRSRAFRRLWGIPAVTYDGQTGGLSTDGSTLVLGSTDPRLLPTSRFLVLDAPSLRTRAAFTLRGSFSFDALSPGGSMLYLIQHVSKQDGSVYAVRAYDLRRRRLLPRVIADRRAWGATMRGYPLTRAMGPGGRWVYTLYMSASGMPFIHALDTVRARAVCVDVPWRGSQDGLWRLRLSLRDGGRALAVVLPGTATAAVLDTRTVALRRAVASRRATPPGESHWPVATAAGAALLFLAVLAFGVRRFGPRREQAPA